MHKPRQHGNGKLGKGSDAPSTFVARVHRVGAIKRPSNTEFRGFKRGPDTNAPKLPERWVWSGSMNRDYRASELGR